MKAVGVIVEYNPFHNGHAYHLQEAKKLTNADVVIAVMSGPFLQRGEPALVSKWARTKMALEGGIDIVLELPYAFATQKAETFASGAVSILNAFGVSTLCFGSEDGNIEPFLNATKVHEDRSELLDIRIRKLLKKGISYPTALSTAFREIQHNAETLNLSKPNNILGFHYVQAIARQNSAILPLTIRRLSAQYHDETFATASIASATSIRKHIQSRGLETATGVMPTSTIKHLRHYYNEHRMFHDWAQYFPLLKYKLLSSSTKELEHIYEAEEGLHYRVLSLIREAVSFTNFMQGLKTKRYTWTRLQRLCLHILTHTTKEQMAFVPDDETSPYARLLGMTQKGRQYLSLHKKHIAIPFLSNIKTFQHPLLDLDIKASAVYFSCLPEPLCSKALKADFIQHPLQYNEKQKQFL
ncbi:MAG: nucleotidyltransferase [Ectobacillus sp.]